MKYSQTEIANILKKIHLSDDEKALHREKLLTFVREHPLESYRAEALIEQTETVEAPKRATFSMTRVTVTLSNVFMRPAFAVPAVLILFVGGGTIFAAEGAVPGDLLYEVKLAVNEKIYSSLAFSETAENDWKIKKTSRRLAEAETLLQEGRLTSEYEARLAEDIQLSSEEVRATAQTNEESGNSNLAQKLKVDLHATLFIHGESLRAKTKLGVQSERLLGVIDREKLALGIADPAPSFPGIATTLPNPPTASIMASTSASTTDPTIVITPIDPIDPIKPIIPIIPKPTSSTSSSSTSTSGGSSSSTSTSSGSTSGGGSTSSGGSTSTSSSTSASGGIIIPPPPPPPAL